MEKISVPLNEYSQLEEMLALRKLGYSYTVLADKFEVPKTTIRYLCRKFGLASNIEVTITRDTIPSTTTEESTNPYNEEVINPGKSYAEYIADEKERRWKRLTHQS